MWIDKVTLFMCQPFKFCYAKTNLVGLADKGRPVITMAHMRNCSIDMKLYLESIFLCW